jgi:hypothetical protein
VTKIAILPAAGNSIRFGRIPKEMLPLPNGRSLIDHAIDRVEFCDRVVIVTSHSKALLHSQLMDRNAKIIQQVGNEMYGAWATVCGLYNADRYYMTMPDTWMPADAFMDCPDNVDFALGVFTTYEPERFGVFAEGGIVNKDENQPVPATAWGALMWTRKVYDDWQKQGITDYTEAIVRAMSRFTWSTWDIGEYHDCATAYHYGKLWERLK